MNDEALCLDCDSPHHARCRRQPRLEVVPPYIRRSPASRLEEWLPFVGGFAAVALCLIEWQRRRFGPVTPSAPRHQVPEGSPC